LGSFAQSETTMVLFSDLALPSFEGCIVLVESNVEEVKISITKPWYFMYVFDAIRV
jgi:hypothetical protein